MQYVSCDAVPPLCRTLSVDVSFVSLQVLYFMVLFVYSVISPLTNFIMAFVFLALGTILRHQFVYVYPTTPDSGGKIWIGFIRIIISCMIIAEVTSEYFRISVVCLCLSRLIRIFFFESVLGLLGLKKASIATPIFIPLLVGTRICIVLVVVVFSWSTNEF